MGRFDCKHCTKLIFFSERGQLYDPEVKQISTVVYCVLELFTNGELFEYIAYNAFSERVTRYYFRQLLKSLGSVHAAGLCHRDLKPENILLDSNYDIKLADFGFAVPHEGRDGSGLNKTYRGTSNYMAPELFESIPYVGAKVDVFSLGVTLFVMLRGVWPYAGPDDVANDKNPVYSWIKQHDYKTFWAYHREFMPSDDFKDLVERMLEYDPEQRISLAEIEQHPWVTQNDVPTGE